MKQSKNTITATVYQVNEAGQVTNSVSFEATRSEGVRNVEKQKDLQMSSIMQSVEKFLETIGNLKRAKVKTNAFDFKRPFQFRFDGLVNLDTIELTRKFQMELRLPATDHVEASRRMVAVIVEGVRFANSEIDTNLTMEGFIGRITAILEAKKAVIAAKRDERKAELSKMSVSERAEYEKDRAKSIELNKVKRASLLAARELGKTEALELINMN